VYQFAIEITSINTHVVVRTSSCLYRSNTQASKCLFNIMKHRVSYTQRFGSVSQSVFTWCLIDYAI